MRFSLPRVFQWSVIALVLAALVGINYDFDSKAGMRMNAPVEDSLSQGLRGYWKMDEGTGTSTTADSSGNANTLSMTGPPTWTTGTIGPSAMDFSGTGQYLSVASPASGVLDFVAGANFSITGWFNRDTFANDHTIVAKRNGQTATDDGYIVYIDDSTDTLVFEASDTADTDEYQCVSTSTFTATGWHQFAVTWNDSATTDPVNIYIDGGLNNGTATGTLANIGDLTESVAFRIGAESDAGALFDGKIDDIRVYSYALSAGEVAKLYQTTAPTQPVDTSLVGHWTFDGPDIQNLTAIDKSGKGNNGTITGAVPTIGKLGQGLSFDGTGNYVELATSSITNFANPMSVCAWAYTTDITADQTIITNLIDGDNCFDFYMWDGTLHFTHYSGAVHTGGSKSGVIGNNIWVHVCAIWSSGSVKLYKNGAELTSLGADADYLSGGSLIGARNNTPDRPMEGRLDDVRIYNRALSAAEITSLYNMGK